MARPQTKDDLLKAANEQFEKLLKLINSSSEEMMIAEFTFDKEAAGKEKHWLRDNNVRDVLTHLYEWHQLLLDWIQSNTGGNAKSFLPAPYTWKTYGEMNLLFWDKHQITTYTNSLEQLKASHENVVRTIEKFSNEELFTNKYFTWTGTTSLGSYCVSATSIHYDWAIKKTRKHIKSYYSK